MHPADCRWWEYEHHPRKAEVLTREVAGLLRDLRRGAVEARTVSEDPRPAHRRLFHDLTFPDREYDAGHYRGEEFRCLQFCSVRIDSDPRVGAAPSLVPQRMRYYATLAGSALFQLDRAHEIPNARLRPEHKLRAAIALACQLFEYVLVVHPFANGNGHAARFVVWSVLGKYGYWPRRWPIDPRPPDPPYTDLIRQNRDGNPIPLEEYILRCIVG